MKISPIEHADLRWPSPGGVEFEAKLASATRRRQAGAIEACARAFGDSSRGPEFSDGAEVVRGHLAGFEPDLAAQLLDCFDAALSFGDPAGRLNVFRDGNLLDVDRLFHAPPGSVRPAVLGVGGVFGSLAEGVTIRFNSFDAVSAVVAEWCASIEAAALAPANANLYVTGSNTPGTRAHVDSHDVLLVQVSGSKRWRIGHPDGAVRVGEGPDVAIATCTHDLVLSAGQTLFLPRGTAHEPHPDGSMSVHVSIGVRRPSRLEVASWLSEEAFSRAGDVPASALAGEPFAGQVLGDLTDRFESRAGGDDVIARWASGQPARRTRSIGALRAAIDARQDPLVWRVPCGPAVAGRADPTNGLLLVVAGGRQIELLAAEVEPFLRLVGGDRVHWASTSSDGIPDDAGAELTWSGLAETIADDQVGRQNEGEVS